MRRGIFIGMNLPSMVKVEVKANLLWILMPNYLALVLRKKPFIRPGHRNASSAYNSESTTVTRALSPSSCSFLPCNGLPVCLLIFTYLNGALTLERGFAKFVLGGAMQQFDHCYCTRYLRLILKKLWLRFSSSSYEYAIALTFYLNPSIEASSLSRHNRVSPCSSDQSTRHCK